MTAIHVYWLNTPPRMKNSPTNELAPGSASDAMATMRNATARRGAPLARPPSLSMSSVPPPRPMIITMVKAAATTTPWLTICSTAPCAAMRSNTMMPSTMNPRCARLE